MKKVFVLLCLSFALLMSACGAEEEVKKSEIKINENNVYNAPSNPSDAQVKLFNKLSKALKGNDDEKIASLVAQNFAFDFFSLKNKQSSQDVGGLTYLPPTQQEEFKTFAMAYVYSEYAVIKNDLGAKHLPMVNEVKVNNIESSVLTYKKLIEANAETGTPEQRIEEDYDGFIVSLSLSYDKSDAKDLKEETSVKVINYDGRYCVIGIES
ncbi:MAG: hypothetical protein EOM50_02030 [Erysipelotrichia bacterium]|nr:hypothetical protein [Erysipelotrichia bacterium]